MTEVAEPTENYGGSWTVEKLEILERYLDAYTTALKNQPFKLMYVDAFAGTGKVPLPDDDGEAASFLSGSAKRAIQIASKPFDKLIFVEKDPDRCANLESLCKAHPDRDTMIENSEANSFLREFQENWQRWRGVLFLDPFATEVKWSTIETIAGWNALDTWILFPISAIARMLPISKRPDDIASAWTTRLTNVFGDESWRELYQMSSQGHLFGEDEYQRKPGVDVLLSIYKGKLSDLFGRRFLEESRTLKNSKNVGLFEFMFCVGSSSPKAISAATGIANHILTHL